MYYLFTVIDGSVLLQMINYIHSSGVVVFFSSNCCVINELVRVIEYISCGQMTSDKTQPQQLVTRGTCCLDIVEDTRWKTKPTVGQIAILCCKEVWVSLRITVLLSGICPNSGLNLFSQRLFFRLCY